MGVRGLFTFVKRHAPQFIKYKTLSDYRGCTIAIDISILLYQLVYKNEQDFLYILFRHMVRWKTLNITPIFVFDGKPPVDKLETIKQRQATRQIVLTHEHYQQCRQLLQNCGVQVMNAIGEAEAEASALTRRGVADYVISEDSDTIIFGARKLLRDFYKTTIVEYDIESIVQHLGLTPAQLVDMTLLVGTDYNNGGIAGYGAEKAYNAIVKYSSLEAMVAEDVIRFGGFEELRKLFVIEEIGAITNYAASKNTRAVLDLLRKNASNIYIQQYFGVPLTNERQHRSPSIMRYYLP